MNHKKYEEILAIFSRDFFVLFLGSTSASDIYALPLALPIDTTTRYTLQLSTPNIHTLICSWNSGIIVLDVNNTTLTLEASAGYGQSYWGSWLTLSLSGNVLTAYQSASEGFGGFLAYY